MCLILSSKRSVQQNRDYLKVRDLLNNHNCIILVADEGSVC